MDSAARETLGLRVRIERVKRRLKQSDLAVLAGVTQADVSQLELDKFFVPARRERILKALGIDDGICAR
jgi:transcriptional regulator with XRE-family HTH domain